MSCGEPFAGVPKREKTQLSAQTTLRHPRPTPHHRTTTALHPIPHHTTPPHSIPPHHAPHTTHHAPHTTQHSPITRHRSQDTTHHTPPSPPPTPITRLNTPHTTHHTPRHATMYRPTHTAITARSVARFWPAPSEFRRTIAVQARSEIDAQALRTEIAYQAWRWVLDQIRVWREAWQRSPPD